MTRTINNLDKFLIFLYLTPILTSHICKEIIDRYRDYIFNHLFYCFHADRGLYIGFIVGDNRAGRYTYEIRAYDT